MRESRGRGAAALGPRGFDEDCWFCCALWPGCWPFGGWDCCCVDWVGWDCEGGCEPAVAVVAVAWVLLTVWEPEAPDEEGTPFVCGSDVCEAIMMVLPGSGRRV